MWLFVAAWHCLLLCDGWFAAGCSGSLMVVCRVSSLWTLGCLSYVVCCLLFDLLCSDCCLSYDVCCVLFSIVLCARGCSLLLFVVVCCLLSGFAGVCYCLICVS